MKTVLTVAATTLAIATLASACGNVSGLSGAPRATFSQLTCLDENGDNRLNADDAADPSRLPDFNADHHRDDKDAAFLRGIDIQLSADRDTSTCNGGSQQPEYLVAHGYFDPSDVSCDKDKHPVLLLGVGGGVKNLKQSGDARGVRTIVDGLQKKYDDDHVQTIGVISGQDMIGAQNGNIAMEQWLTNAVRVYLTRFPCLRAVLIGHSHGAVTVDVVASKLESEFKDRFIEVVNVDRVVFAYGGDTESWPQQVRVFNIFETNDPSGTLQGAPREQPNVENWNATDEQAPEGGKSGAPAKPVTHVSIDNSKSVRDRVIEDVIAHSD